MAKKELLNERHDAKNGETIRLNESKKDGFAITSVRQRTKATYENQETAEKAFKALCDLHDGKERKAVNPSLASKRAAGSKKPSGGEPIPEKPKENKAVSFGTATWKACIDKKIIASSKSDGFSFGDNALGKSKTAGIREIKSNPALLKAIKSALKKAK